MAELEGALIAGKYRVKHRIGSGGMGAVYEGEHVEIGKRVAIKVIEHENARSDELAARFRREARAASAIESEHIVHVFDVGKDDVAGLYMVMELLTGEDLSVRLASSGGKIDVGDAVGIGVQAARALAKAHAAGVVHRDLKPANLFLTTREDGTVCVKILDFGISKLVKDTGDKRSNTLTREGAVMGTPMYMSPEQAQGLAIDARSDVWSLGAVIYEALAGRTAWEQRDTYEQMIVQIVTKKPAPLHTVAPWVPEAIASVIDGALVHDLDARVADAATFARHLAEAGRLPAPTPSSPSLPELAPASAPQHSPPTATGVVVGARTQLEAGIPRKPGRMVYVAAGLIGLAAIGGLAAFVTTKREPTPPPAAGGLIAPTPSASVAVTAALSLLPLEAPSASASTAPVASTKPAVSARPPRPTTTTTTGATTTKPASTQYGGAGVSTAY